MGKDAIVNPFQQQKWKGECSFQMRLTILRFIIQETRAPLLQNPANLRRNATFGIDNRLNPKRKGFPASVFLLRPAKPIPGDTQQLACGSTAGQFLQPSLGLPGAPLFWFSWCPPDNLFHGAAHRTSKFASQYRESSSGSTEGMISKPPSSEMHAIGISPLREDGLFWRWGSNMHQAQNLINSPTL